MPLPGLPEPFASFPALPRIALPNASRGVPGVTFARDARKAGHAAALAAPLYTRTPPFPSAAPWPASSHVTPILATVITPGSPVHNLASAYWAFGWCEGMHEAISRAPAEERARFIMHRFPPTRNQMTPPYPDYDAEAVRACADPYAPPKWAEWFAKYSTLGQCKVAPESYWPHAKRTAVSAPAPAPDRNAYIDDIDGRGGIQHHGQGAD